MGSLRCGALSIHSLAQTPGADSHAQDIEKKEEELKAKQDATALQIEKAMAQDLKDEPPPKMPSEKDMKNPQKMQEYMLQARSPARCCT